MQLVIPRETQPGENRVSATPETVKKLVRLGAEVVIESGAGTGAGISDADYEAAGASIGYFKPKSTNFTCARCSPSQRNWAVSFL